VVEEFVICSIVDKRDGMAGRVEYKVSWEGFPGEDSWEPIENLTEGKGMVVRCLMLVW
jgi:hypothetical protein